MSNYQVSPFLVVGLPFDDAGSSSSTTTLSGSNAYGSFEINAQGIFLVSPGGFRYQLYVLDNGTLSTYGPIVTQNVITQGYLGANHIIKQGYL